MARLRMGLLGPSTESGSAAMGKRAVDERRMNVRGMGPSRVRLAGRRELLLTEWEK